jgi:SnoaL-like polyketide cyclase
MTREHIESLFERRRAAIGRHDSAALASLHAESGLLELLVDGDRAVEVATIRGTATGGFGLPPTDKPFQLPMINLCTLNHEGHIAHERRVYDFTGLLLQIGLLEARPA